MDREVEKYPPGDVTKPWKRQFFKTVSIGPEPPINARGFWEKPKHGLKPALRRKAKNDRSDNASK